MSISCLWMKIFSFFFSPQQQIKLLELLAIALARLQWASLFWGLWPGPTRSILPIKKKPKSLKIMKKNITTYWVSQVGSHPLCLVSHLSPERCEPCLVLSLITAKKFMCRPQKSNMCRWKHGFSLNLAAGMSWLPPSSGINTKSLWRAEWLLRKTHGFRLGSWGGRCWREDERIVVCEGKSREQEDLSFLIIFGPQLLPLHMPLPLPCYIETFWGQCAILSACNVRTWKLPLKLAGWLTRVSEQKANRHYFQ